MGERYAQTDEPVEPTFGTKTHDDKFDNDKGCEDRDDNAINNDGSNSWAVTSLHPNPFGRKPSLMRSKFSCHRAISQMKT